jgi:hypothetical protein
VVRSLGQDGPELKNPNPNKKQKKPAKRFQSGSNIANQEHPAISEAVSSGFYAVLSGSYTVSIRFGSGFHPV